VIILVATATTVADDDNYGYDDDERFVSYDS